MGMFAVFPLAGCKRKASASTSGKASGVAQGKGGDVRVTVTVEDGVITSVDIEGKNETPTIGGVAIEEMPQQIIDAQSFDVDGVAGATRTSDAIRTAGKEAYGKIAKTK